MKEIWKSIPEYEGWYSASNLGNVRRDKEGSATHKGRILLKQTNPRGYSIVCINNIPNQKKTFKVASLIARTFFREREPDEVINHRNGIKTDDRSKNLEYISQSMNVIHAYEVLNHKAVSGKSHWNGKKTKCKRGHPYSPENTYVDKKTNRRTCRICRLNNKRRLRNGQTQL